MCQINKCVRLYYIVIDCFMKKWLSARFTIDREKVRPSKKIFWMVLNNEFDVRDRWIA